MLVLPLDLADDGVLAAAYEVERAANRQARPEWVARSLEARTLGWRADDGWSKQLHGTWDGARLEGFASSLSSREEPDTSWIFAWVHPDYAGRGIGSALMRAAEATCPPTTTRFVTSVCRPTPDGVAALGARFFAPLGYTVATTETVVELDLGAAELPPTPVLGRYRVHTHVNGVPGRFREQVGHIKGLVDAEAPNGDLGWTASSVTPAEYQQEIDLWVEQGSTVIESIAVDDGGEVAAWTCLVTSTTVEGPTEVEGTLVLRAHRGHGLGAAVKLASLHAAGAQGAAGRVRTSSDDQNSWMRSINAALGFLPVESEAIFHKVGPAGEHLPERSAD